MAWSVSGIFNQFIGDVLANTAAFDLSGASVDTIRAVLYNNTPTPDRNVSAANSAFDAGQWDNANEVSDSGQWDAGGLALVNPAITVGTDLVKFDADNPASGSSATLQNVYGVYQYDDTLTTPVANQGICFNYLGGANGVTDGTFTVVYHDDGLFEITQA